MDTGESNNFVQHLPFLEEEISPVDKTLLKIRIDAYTETGRKESTIPVLKQRSYTGIRVIPSALANTPCTTLGIVGILDKFNATLGKSYRLDSHPTLHSFLNSCIEQNYDFGTAYAHFRYNSSWVRTSTNLLKGEVKDREMRREAVIHDGRIIRRKSVPPRRIWDLCANRVVPYWVASRDSPMGVRVEGISHAWMDANDRRDVWTPINGYEWPVPLPNDADLDLIRIELLNLLGVLGVEYVWLDVLCLRQKYDVREDHREEDLHREALRIDEWKLDVPTIGYVYESSVQMVCYLCGLGRPLSWGPSYLVGERSWFNRAWTLQETRDRYQHQAIIAGETGDDNTRTMFHNKLKSLRDVFSAKDIIFQMRTRVSTNPIDRVAGLVYRLRLRYITIYDANQSEESAWEQLVNAMMYSFRADLFFCYPEPGDGRKYWRPSWTQVMDTTFPTDPSIWSSINRMEETDIDWFEGNCIYPAHIQGLADASNTELPRRGELVLTDHTGVTHTVDIFAKHHYLIRDGLYTLLHENDVSLVVGHWRQNGIFQKESVISMENNMWNDDLKKLGQLGIVKDRVKIVLC